MKAWLRQKLRHRQRLRDCRRGVSAIEFAVLAPVLISLLVCGAEIEDAVVALRKVTGVVHTMANLTTQYETMSTSDVSLVMNASLLVLEPYSQSPAQITLTEVSISGDGTGKVVWSCGLNATPHDLGAIVSVPGNSSDSDSDGGYLIYAEARYKYTPWVMLPKFSIPQIPLYQTLFMAPRQSTSVPLSAASGDSSSSSSSVNCLYQSSLTRRTNQTHTTTNAAQARTVSHGAR